MKKIRKLDAAIERYKAAYKALYYSEPVVEKLGNGWVRINPPNHTPPLSCAQLLKACERLESREFKDGKRIVDAMDRHTTFQRPPPHESRQERSK